MAETCIHRLSHRSLSIRHVGRQHHNIIAKRLCQHFALDRRYQLSFSTSYAENRHSTFHVRFPSSKRSNHYHRRRFFSNLFSNENQRVRVFSNLSIDTPSASPFIGLSSDDTSPSGKSCSFQLFLDSFPETIKKNVNNIICKVDAASQSSTKNSLRKQWEVALRVEKERRRCLNNIGSRKPFSQQTKRSIEAQWDEFLRRNGHCIILRSSERLEAEKRAESLHRNRFSPVFRFPADGKQCLINFENIAFVEGEEHSDDFNRDKVQRIANNSRINKEEEKFGHADLYDATLESISLLIAMRPDDWRKCDSNAHLSTERSTATNRSTVVKSDCNNEISSSLLVNAGTHLNQIRTDVTKTRHFFRHIIEHQFVLTTSFVNLLLAHLVTSTDNEHQEIGDLCLQIFEEMKIVSASGQHDCTPDCTTYRILILAFSRRFQGVDEAIKLSHELVESTAIDVGPELLNEALKACQAKMELTVATSLMNSALSSNRIKLNAGSCILYTKMLKDRKFDREAINFFNRISKTNLLTRDEEDYFLMYVCRWPTRSRRGDLLDLSSFWANIFNILEQNMRSAKIPEIRVWITFLEGLYNSAMSDASLWNLTAGVTRMILDSYPRSFVGSKIMAIGLHASTYVHDPQLASVILQRLAMESNASNHPSDLTGTYSDRQKFKVPFRLLKTSLKTCLATSDAKSAQSIQESMDQIDDPYPLGAKSELYSLVVMCHAKVNDAENARKYLQMMLENNMKPSEELYSKVIYAIAMVGRYQEAEELFQSIQMGCLEEIKPTISSYDAIIFARAKGEFWDDIISLCEEMKDEGIVPNSRIIKALITASKQRGGRKSVLLALDSLLQCNAHFDESAFRAASETIYKDVDENLDDFRRTIREIGKVNKNLQSLSLDLVRSIRSAENESNRPRVVNELSDETKHSSENAWRLATSHLLSFVQMWSQNNGGAD